MGLHCRDECFSLGHNETLKELPFESTATLYKNWVQSEKCLPYPLSWRNRLWGAINPLVPEEAARNYNNWASLGNKMPKAAKCCQWKSNMTWEEKLNREKVVGITAGRQADRASHTADAVKGANMRCGWIRSKNTLTQIKLYLSSSILVTPVQ